MWVDGDDHGVSLHKVHLVSLVLVIVTQGCVFGARTNRQNTITKMDGTFPDARPFYIMTTPPIGEEPP